MLKKTQDNLLNRNLTIIPYFFPFHKEEYSVDLVI